MQFLKINRIEVVKIKGKKSPIQLIIIRDLRLNVKVYSIGRSLLMENFGRYEYRTEYLVDFMLK